MAHGPVRSKSAVRRSAPFAEEDDDEDATAHKSLKHASIFNPSEASASAPAAPAAAAFDAFPTGEADEEMGKPSKGRGKGSGKGKGKRKSDGRDGKGNLYSTAYNDVMQTHAKALLQLDQNCRNRDRESQWAFVLPLNSPLVRLLDQTAQDWKHARPEGGKHPSGLLHEYLWATFANNLLESLSKFEEKSKSRATGQLRAFLEDSLVSDSKFQPSGRDTYVEIFRPVQNKLPITGQWIWIFRANMALSNGRDIHELLAYWHDKFSEILAPITIQKDRVPQTGLFRAVEGQLKALAQ